MPPFCYCSAGSLFWLRRGVEPAKAQGPAEKAQSPAAPDACAQEPKGGGPKERFRIIDSGNSRLVGFNMDDDDNVSFGSPTGSPGSGNGEMDNPQGAGYIIGSSTYVADTGNDRIQVFDWKLRYDFQFDASDSDEGALDAPTPTPRKAR